MLVLGAVAAGFGYSFYKEAMSAQSDLRAAQKSLSALPGLLSRGDTEGLTAVSTEALAHTERAETTVQGQLWTIAAEVPFVGANVSAVRQTAKAVNLLVRDALPSVLTVLDTIQLDKVRVEGGGFDLEPFRGVQGTLTQISASFDSAQEIISGIDRTELLPVVDEAIGEVLTVISETAPTLGTVEQNLPTLLAMAGGEGPRTYLLIFQNNAEIRATGGNPAASAVMQVDAGRMSLLDQADSSTFYEAGTAGRGYADLPAETLALYDDEFTRFSQNYSRTPNFPTTSLLFSSLWTATTGQALDGVISIDPVALSHILRATGPVQLADGTEISSENAVKVLLSDIYELTGGGAIADAFFADAAARVFSQLIGGGWNMLAMAEQLERSATEQRIYATFTREEENALTREAGIDGQLSTDTLETTEVGIFLNNSSVSKLEYYLSSAVSVSCDVAARSVTTTISLHNSIPSAELSQYTLGARNGRLGLPSTTMLLDAVYVAPPGSAVDASAPSTSEVAGWDRHGIEQGRQAKSVTVAVPQGASRDVSFTSVLPEGVTAPLKVRHTPTATATPVTVAASCTDLLPGTE